MKTPTGSALVAAITQILKQENQKGKEVKRLKSKGILSSFSEDQQIPDKVKAVSSLSRLVRKLDGDAIRQIRSMSDSLLNKDERELKTELFALRDQLMPIESDFHNLKTKSAFVTTMLRPFSPEYTSTWFQDRDDIDVNQAKAKIEKLEIMKISSPDELIPWAQGVAEVFEQVVVYRGSDVGDLYARPTGTVSEKSSKTYLQAWSAFINLNRERAWSLAAGEESEYAPLTWTTKSYRKNESLAMSDFDLDDLPGLDQDVPSELQESLMMAPPPARGPSKIRVMKSAPPPKSSKGNEFRGFEPSEQNSQWIQIFIESKLDSSAQATRRWESQAEFTQSLQKWLDNLPVIWGPAADQFVAKVSVKTATGESDLTLPSLTAKDAEKRITQAVKMQSD
jgi:hypothetical protein